MVITIVVADVAEADIVESIVDSVEGEVIAGVDLVQVSTSQ